MSDDRQPTPAQWAAAKKRTEARIADALLKVRYREQMEAMKKTDRPV
ncbi:MULTISPECIES: hypothetical protein [Brevundimonas]|jgi:hypothetical protein|nr:MULTISPECIES: hypothetical protein [Brevundimonas]